MPTPTARPIDRPAARAASVAHPPAPDDPGGPPPHARLGALIASHTSHGRTVSVPIGAAPYDLVVDDAGELTCVAADGTTVARRVRGRAVGGVQLGLFAPADPAPVAPTEVPPAPADIARDNPRDQGALGFGDAVGWFAAHGYLVSIPLIDNQPYDLVVDDGHDLARVQVKTTRHRSPYGIFVVHLQTNGGNQSFHTSKLFDPEACELLYALTDHGQRYVIPTEVVTAKRGLSLGTRVARYRVT